jgi:hypothetical protein
MPRRADADIVESDSLGGRLLDLVLEEKRSGRLPLPLVLGKRGEGYTQAVMAERPTERCEHGVSNLEIADPEPARIVALDQRDLAVEGAGMSVEEVTPDFLDAVLDQVQEAGLDVVSLDEAVRRLRGEDERRFVCFTFDDGYRDNLEYAYHLFKKRALPPTLYVPTDYPDGNGEPR